MGAHAASARIHASSAASAISAMEVAALGYPLRSASADARWSCQMAAIPSRANIVNASFSVIVRTRGISDLLPRHTGIAVDLVTRAAQAVETVPVDIPFPGQELIDRELVEPARLLDGNPAAAHGFDDGRLAPYRPPSAQRRQLGHRAECIWVIRRVDVPEHSEQCRRPH